MKTEFEQEKKQNINKKWQQFKNTNNRFYGSSSDEYEKKVSENISSQ